MKKFSLLIVFILCFTCIIPSNGKANERIEIKGNTTTTEDSFSHPIISIETGEETGKKTYDVTTKTTIKKNGYKEVTINSLVTIENYYDNTKTVETDESILVFNDDKLISINGSNNFPSDSEDKLVIDSELRKKIQPLADKFNNNQLSYDDYLNEIKKIGLKSQTGFNSQVAISEDKDNEGAITLSSGSGGLYYLTTYQPSVFGGYFLRTSKAKSMWSSLDALTLSKGVELRNTMTSAHNFLSGSQGGLVSSFMIRADNIASAHIEVTLEAVALTVILGVAALTVATVLGALGSLGTAGVIAARIYIVSSGAHNDVEKAYEIVENIQSRY